MIRVHGLEPRTGEVIPPFRNVGLVHDARHRAALLSVDRFTPPATIDESEATAARYEVTSTPTLIVFSRGEPRARHVGLTDKKTLRRLLDEAGTDH